MAIGGGILSLWPFQSLSRFYFGLKKSEKALHGRSLFVF